MVGFLKFPPDFSAIPAAHTLLPVVPACRRQWAELHAEVYHNAELQHITSPSEPGTDLFESFLQTVTVDKSHNQHYNHDRISWTEPARSSRQRSHISRIHQTPANGTGSVICLSFQTAVNHRSRMPESSMIRNTDFSQTMTKITACIYIYEREDHS